MAEFCYIESCNNRAHGTRKYCSAHYERRRKYGSFQEDKPIESRESHNMYKSREYSTWLNAKDRVTNKKSDMYYLYGERGITMCERWKNSFLAFYKDMGERPEGMTLDRIDVNGNYEKSNCRWATPTTQSINQRIRITNKSGVKGVSWDKRRDKWTAFITVNYKHIFLGSYDDLKKAAVARKEAELTHWGFYAS